MRIVFLLLYLEVELVYPYCIDRFVNFTLGWCSRRIKLSLTHSLAHYQKTLVVTTDVRWSICNVAATRRAIFAIVSLLANRSHTIDLRCTHKSSISTRRERMRERVASRQQQPHRTASISSLPIGPKKPEYLQYVVVVVGAVLCGIMFVLCIRTYSCSGCDTPHTRSAMRRSKVQCLWSAPARAHAFRKICIEFD